MHTNNCSSSCEQQETEISYETARNDTEMENIEVDEPIIQKVRHAYVKQETNDMPDPLYTGDYLDASPKRKSPTKKPSTIQNGKLTYFKLNVRTVVVIRWHLCCNFSWNTADRIITIIITINANSTAAATINTH